MPSRSLIVRDAILSIALLLCAGCQIVPSGQPARHPALVNADLPDVVPAWELLETQFATRSRYKLSPDGTKLAWTALTNNRGYRAVHVQPVQGGPTTVMAGTAFPIIEYYWAADSRHLLMTKDLDGSENEHILLADVEKPGSAPIDLTPAARSRNIVDDIPLDKPGTVYLRGNERNPATFDLYAVDIATGRRTLFAENDGTIQTWIFDEAGALRARVRQGRLEVADAASGAWRTTFALDGALKILSSPDEKGRVWATSNRHRDQTSLVRLDLNTGGEEVVYLEPSTDLAEVVIDRANRMPLAAASWPDYQNVYLFDPRLGKVLDRFNNDKRNIVSIASADYAFKKLIVQVATDEAWEDIYILDREAESLRLLVRNEGVVWRDRISPTEPFSFTSRDGKTIHGFLTTPKGVKAKGLPMVVLVHGGPWSEDRWGFSDSAQFLANRGYAVLRINYRGSSGHGRAFLLAAVHEFAGKMHQDLVDGVRWAIDRGVADPAHIAIMGASYGGYAALVGLTVTPELFAAGIEMNGMSDLAAFSDHLPPYWPPDIWRTFVGDPRNAADRKAMIDRSPLAHVDRITSPLLALQSTNDVRVKHDQFDSLIKAMRAAGKPVEAIEFPNEGHTPRRAKDYYEFYRASELFLGKHLGGRVGP